MKRKALLLIIPFAAAGLAGCQQANPPTPAPQCDSATVSITSAGGVTAIKPGEQLQLTAQVNLDNCSFSWDSTNKSVATVDSNGLVTAISVGETTIKYGSGEFELSVEENPAPHVTEVLSVKSHPQSVMVDGSIEPSSVILNVKLSDGTETTKAATKVDCDTSKAADSVEATAWYNQIGSAKFNIKVTSEFVPEYGTEDNPLTVTQALATIQAECPEDNTYTKQAIYCTGTITEVTSSGEYEGGDFWFALKCTDGTTEIVVYRIHTTEAQKELIKVGAQIKWVGFAKNFKGTLEFVDSGSSKCTLLDSGTPTPQKEVVEVLGVKSHPESVIVGGSISPSSVILNVKLSDGSESTAAATRVECNTQSEADSVEATAWYNQIGSAKFNIKVVAQGQAAYGTEDNPISVSQAIATMSIDCPADTNLTKQAMYCIGTVKQIKNVYHYQDDIGSDCFELVLTDGTNDVIVYRLHSTDDLKDQVAEGNEIKICGYGKNFKGTLEFVDNGATKCTLLDNGTPTPQKEVTGITAVSYTKTLYVGGTINPADVTLTVSYSDDTSGAVKAQSVDGYSTEEAGNTTATAHYGTFTKDFVVEVKAKPAPTGESSIYTFTNDKTSSQNMGTWTSEQFLEHVVVDGDEVITGIKDVTNAYIGGNGGSGDTAWELWNCFKVGKSNAGGTATLTLDSSIVFESIKVSAIGNRDDGTLTINGVTKNVTKKAAKGSLEPMELEFEVAGGISELTFSSKEASSGNYGICITKIEFVGGGTPTPQKQITGVELQGTLEKSSYIEGQTFDPSGLSLKVTYNEGDPDVLTSGFTFNVTNPLAVGEYDLKATYEGHTTEGSVHISVVAKELVSIAITHGMNKTTYQVGDEWDATGIVVEGTYNDGDIQIIPSTSYELSYNPTKATDIEVTSVSIVAKMVAGDEISSEAYPQTVTVQSEPLPEPKLDSISVANASGKTNKYTEGDVISKDDLVVTAHYTEGKPDAVVTDYTISLTTALKTTDTSATITYSEDGEIKTATYSFTVAEKSTTQTVEFDLMATYKEASGESNGVSFVADKASGQNAPFHNDDCGLRVYANNTLTISASGITKVTFTINECGCEKADADFTADVGTYSEQVWTGNADTIVFTAGSRQVHVSKIVVECGPEKQITSLGTVTAPATIVKDGTLDPKDVDVAVTYDNKTTGSVHPDSIDLNTSAVSDSVTGTVHVGDLTATFTIKVVDAPVTQTYTLTIDIAALGSPSAYSDNNDVTIQAVSSTGSKIDVVINFTQIMNNSGMQFKASKGFLYNKTDLGKINSVTIKDNNGKLSAFYGTAALNSRMTSGTTTAGNYGFFNVSDTTSNAGKASSIVIVFEK